MKIDVSEVRVQKELLVISVNSIKEQLSVSRSRLSEVVSTDSLKGAVKDAINQKVTNYQIPLVDNYVNALDSIVSRYDGLVKLFQDTVSETDNSAIINTEYLEHIKQRMKDPIEGLKSSSSKTQNIYAGISDILTLTNPSLDSVNTNYSQAVKSLDDTIKNMEAFELHRSFLISYPDSRNDTVIISHTELCRRNPLSDGLASLRLRKHF